MPPKRSERDFVVGTVVEEEKKDATNDEEYNIISKSGQHRFVSDKVVEDDPNHEDDDDRKKNDGKDLDGFHHDDDNNDGDEISAISTIHSSLPNTPNGTPSRAKSAEEGREPRFSDMSFDSMDTAANSYKSTVTVDTADNTRVVVTKENIIIMKENQLLVAKKPKDPNTKPVFVEMKRYKKTRIGVTSGVSSSVNGNKQRASLSSVPESIEAPVPSTTTMVSSRSDSHQHLPPSSVSYKRYNKVVPITPASPSVVANRKKLEKEEKDNESRLQKLINKFGTNPDRIRLSQPDKKAIVSASVRQKSHHKEERSSIAVREDGYSQVAMMRHQQQHSANHNIIDKPRLSSTSVVLLDDTATVSTMADEDNKNDDDDETVTVVAIQPKSRHKQITIPPVDTLGIVIDAVAGEGLVVNDVVNHSPFRGQIQSGDIVTHIDDVDIRWMKPFLITLLIQSTKMKQRNFTIMTD